MSDPEQKTGDQQTDPPSQRRAWAFRLVAMAITVMLGLVCGEVAVCVFNIGPEFANVSRWNFRICDNPVLQYELHPGTTDGHGTRINPDGMRDRAYTVAKPPGTFRIACIGDSICFGTQIEQADTFSSKLEAELNRRFASAPICEVLNFGVAGYDIDQINENLRVRALKYKPDLIIYAYCLNDPEVWNPTFNMLRGGLNQAENEYLTRLMDRSVARSRLYMLSRYMWHLYVGGGREQLAQVNLVESPDLVRRGFADYHAWLHEPPRFDRLTKGLADLATTARQHDIPVYVVLFPLLLESDTYPLAETHAKITAAVTAESMRVLDLTPTYYANPNASANEVAVDKLHPNVEGNRLAADTILQRLLQDNAIPSANPAR